MIHTTVGIYPSGDRKVNGVPSETLAEHIRYNLVFRPGRAFFVDGVPIHRGTLNYCQLEDARKLVADIKITEDTQPYQ